MGDIKIDRLALEVPEMSEAGAQSLALAIANQLGVAGLPATPVEMPVLRVDLTAASGGDTSQLAEQIVSEVMRQLQRSP